MKRGWRETCGVAALIKQFAARSKRRLRTAHECNLERQPTRVRQDGISTGAFVLSASLAPKILWARTSMRCTPAVGDRQSYRICLDHTNRHILLAAVENLRTNCAPPSRAYDS